MSDILCKWLNEEVKLTASVDPSSLAKLFSNGYLVGEILHRFGLQDDFPLFSNSGSSDTKLGNFTRIEPTLALLDIKFNTNMAKEIIAERPGMATRLIYQLFIALGRKEKMNLTGAAMETMRPSGPKGLGTIESDMYKERLKTLVPRQVDLDFDDLVAKYDNKQKEMERQALQAQMAEDEQNRKIQQRLREDGIQRSKEIRESQDNLMKKIKEATVQIGKAPPKKGGDEKTRAEMKKQREVQSTIRNIATFENSLQQPKPPPSPKTSEDVRELLEKHTQLDAQAVLVELSPNKKMRIEKYVRPEQNDDYIGKIRNRLNEDEHARKEREKRRRRVLVEQMKAHLAQQDAVREDQLVQKLMRQSQMERRIAVQLMQVRKQKDIMKQNRLEQERQYIARRERDFEDALAREAEACRQAKIDYEEEVAHQQAIHEDMKKERERLRTEKHTAFCRETLMDVVDFSYRVAEYRELTDRLLPPKLVREWKALFLAGQPLFSTPVAEPVESEETLRELEKQRILDEEDFMEYSHFVGDWQPKDAEEYATLTKNNDVLGFVVKRLNDIVNPPTPPPEAPKFPAFPIKACVLGKFFAGKSGVISRITETHRVECLAVDLLVHEALEAYKQKEMVEVPDPEFPPSILSGAAETPVAGAVQGGETPAPTTPGALTPVAAVVVDAVKEDQAKAATPQQQPMTPAAADAATPTSAVDTKESTDTTGPPETPTMTDHSVRDCESEMSIKIDDTKMQLSARAKLGLKAMNHLKKGRVLPDALLVEIMVEAIRRIPEGTGWILDNFPINIHQAKMLEKALTGYEAPGSPRKSAMMQQQKDQKKGKKSKLVQDPIPSPEAKPHISGIDIVILFDIDNETVLKRAEGRTFDPQSGEVFHQEFQPPIEGTYTGLQNKSKVLPVLDSANDREQAQIRLATFQENWPKLEKWFTKFHIMTRIDVDREEELNYIETVHVLEETLERLQKPPTPPPEPEPEPEPVKEEPTPPPAPELEPTPEPVTPSKRGRGKSPKGGKSKSPAKTPSKERGSSKGKASPSPSRKGSAKGRKGSKSPSKAPSEEIIPETPPRPPSPEPGSKEWVWVTRDIDKDLVEVLLNYWNNNVETTYVDSCKHVFRNIRAENESIYRYFFETRKAYVEFLKRPDEKQEFVMQWQKEFNNFAEDMRSDEEAKAELHQRLDDLCDRLWDICDGRKEEAEQERTAVMKEGWLEDRVGLLTNHYVSFMQAEVERYQQTCKMLRDYYTGMEAGVETQKVKMITEGVPSFARVPLVELIPTLAPGEEPEVPLDQSVSVTPAEEPPVKGKRPGSSASRRSTKKSKSPEPVEPVPIPEEGEQKKIPLVPRRPVSVAEPTPSRQDTKREKKTTPRKERSRTETKPLVEEAASPVSPPPPSDPDEKLLFDALMAVLQVIEAQNAQDLADEEAEAEDANKPDLSKTASKDKGKKGKGKSPAPGKKSPARGKSPRSRSKLNVADSTSEVPETLSEEDAKKKLLAHNTKKEYKTAVANEGNGLKARVERIKEHAAEVILRLKSKAKDSYGDMDDWLGKRYREEMESIEAMSLLVRHAIEDEMKLQDACILQDKEFFIDDDLHVFLSPTPPPPPTPSEPAYRVWFTCQQLEMLIKQFKNAAPHGYLSIKAFSDQLLDVPHVTVGMEYLPDIWMNVSPEQVMELGKLLSADGEHIDWRHFVVSILQPFPYPSVTELLKTRRDCFKLDDTGSGLLSKEQYDQMPLWIEEYDHLNPLNDDDSIQYDRMKHLREVLYVLFSDRSKLLDYVKMLMYLSVCENRVNGFMRALSVVTGQEMPAEDDLHSLFLREDHGIPKQKGESYMISAEQWVKVLESCRVKPKSESEESFETKVALVYGELCEGSDVQETLPLALVYRHPLMKDLIDSCTQYKSVDSQVIFQTPPATDDLIPEEKTFI